LRRSDLGEGRGGRKGGDLRVGGEERGESGGGRGRERGEEVKDGEGEG